MKRALLHFRLLSVLLGLMCLPACSGDEPQPSAPGGGGGESVGAGGGAAAEAVDLGLSVRWAACNMGASAPHEAGGLYGWGDPTGQAVTSQVHDEDYNWTSSLYGGADPMPDICRTTLDLPHMQLGDCWRLPSEDEARELVERCVWREETRQGVKGYTVTGPNGRSIFLPMAGMRVGAEPYDQGRRGYYWTGTRQPGATGAVSLHVGGSTGGQISSDYRYQGCSVRPVLGTDSTTFTYDSPLDTVDRRVDMGVLSDSGKPLYWASGNLVVRRYARAYIAHEPTFVPEHRIFSEEALEWDLFSWGDATGRIKYYSPEWKALDVSSLPSDISGDARYDVARAQLGGNWRLPTEAEWWRLRENATIRYEGAGKYFKIWVTSKINGNVLCFYAADYLAFLDPDYSQLRCDYTCFLTGNRRVAQFSYFISDMLVDKPDVGGMFFVRPVTE